MSYSTCCKGKDLQIWANSLEARQKLPALVRRLIHGTVECPKLIQFPADEGIQRRGWDGVLEVESGNAWVPTGKSVWEMGADQDPEAKASNDYEKRTQNLGATNPAETTFVFVTPRKWEGKNKWLEQRRAEKKWLNVLVWDCDDLEQWLETAPSEDAWLARLLGKLPTGVRDLSSYWSSLAATSNPPLTPAVFLAGRAKAEKEFRVALRGAPSEITISASSLAEVRDFISSVLAKGDEETDGAATARALVVDTVDAWNQLAVTKNRLLLIPGDQLALDKPMVAEAVKAGHHVVTQRPYALVREGPGIRLPRADRWELQQALEAAGFSVERASRFAREAGGCVSILIRLASQFAGQGAPAWCKQAEIAQILSLVLIGTWSDRNEEDRKVVERLTGKPYASIQQMLIRSVDQPEAPLRLVEGIYSFASREESWQLLSPRLTNDLLKLFSEIATSILDEDDPRFDMPAGERYLARIYKKLPRHSPEMRKGIAETIALLGTRGEHTPQGASEGSSWRAARIVTDLLNHASTKRWFTLAPVLPLLAEAAPDEFLSALESDLQQPAPAIAALFEKDADGFFTSSPHTSLMWALALLAWDTAHLCRVVRVLAALIKLDSGGRTNPRPASVMYDIFRFWYPQTSATVDERLQVLDILSKCEPEVAWTLLVGLIPQGHDTAISTVKPRWRDYDSSQARQVTDQDIERQVEWAAAHLIEITKGHPEKWPLLLKDFRKLPPFAQGETLKWLRELEVESLPASARTEIWEKVRELVQEHRFFHDAWWAMPKPIVDSLAEVEQKIIPVDPVVRYKWLFHAGTTHTFGDMETPYEERERLEAEAQREAVREVFEKAGLSGVFELGSGALFHVGAKIGTYLAQLGLLKKWQELLPEKLVSEAENERAIALGYAIARRAVEGDSWAQSLPLEQWSEDAVGVFGLSLPFGRATWQQLRSRKPEAESAYWRRVNPSVWQLNDDELEEAVSALLQNGRPMAAVQALSMAIHAHKKPSWKIVADTVDLALASPETPPVGLSNQVVQFEAAEVMKYLQADPTGDQDRLAMLEWRLLPLAGYSGFQPKLLHSELCKSPAFFSEVLAAIYRPKGEARPQKPDPVKENLSRGAAKLLDSWVGIPGTKTDGSVDSDILNAWITDARKFCTASGRAEVCDLKIGEQLSYAPVDADGSWPCKAVRDVFETTTTDELLRGFETGTLNQRGVTTRGLNDGGAQERDLVKKYRTYADRCKVAWPRTALALRRIVDYYEAHAKWQDARAEARE